MKKIYRVPVFILVISLLYGCNICKKNEHTKTEEIGPEGGRVITESGAVLAIPPGALVSSTEITITSYKDQAELPENQVIFGSFLGGLALSPEGLEFQSPVTITIPLNNTFTGQEEVKVFYYDTGDENNSYYPDNYSGWQQQVLPGLVSTDGKSVMFHAEHLSTYVIQMNFGEDTIDILGSSVETLGDNGLGVDFYAYQSYFESAVANIGDLHVHNMPEPFGYDCYQVVGLEYRLYHNLGALYEQPLETMKGEAGEIAFEFNYEGDRALNDAQLIYHLFITVHMNITPPSINLTSGVSSLQTGDQTPVTCALICGSEPMIDQEIYFSVNSLGTINPSDKLTDSNGDARIQFRAGDTEGVGDVMGEYVARDSDEIAIISDDVSIVIEEEEPPDDTEVPEIEIWSFQIISNYDSVNSDDEVSASKRTTIDGTFEVDFSSESYSGRTEFTGTATGTGTYAKLPFEWYGEIGPGGAYSGSCPGSYRSQTKAFSVEGIVWGDDREYVDINLTNLDPERIVSGTITCNTSVGQAEWDVSYYLLFEGYNGTSTRPFEEGVYIVTEEPSSNSIYSWELNKLSSSP